MERLNHIAALPVVDIETSKLSCSAIWNPFIAMAEVHDRESYRPQHFRNW
jgi:hypothetical protein